MSAEVRTLGRRPLSAHALKQAGLGRTEFPEGGGAIYASVCLGTPSSGLRCIASDETGERIASAEFVGDTERQVARVNVPRGPARPINVRIEDASGQQPANIVDVRVVARPDSEHFALKNWRPNAARWLMDELVIVQTGEILSGPTMEHVYPIAGEIAFEAVSNGPMVIGLWLRETDEQKVVAGRYWLVNGPIRGIVPFRDLPPGKYSPTLVAQYIYDAARPTLRGIDLEVRHRFVPKWEDKHNTYLPNWNKLQRFIHRQCKNSSGFNSFVQGLEFRLGREELMSVPRYMSFCPTGQCNALCDFCSVTINRTGIIKKQIDRDLIERFTQPIRRSVAMYGLEGNGEPTLHRGFPELVDDLTSSASDAYLITNGSRFSESLLPSLMRLESVNVSLNAATKQTHRAVMKLKEHDVVVHGLKRIVQTRGFNDPGLQVAANPRVSVSFVVTRQNAHEIERFLEMAEDEIGVDVALIRPLSELGNELGAVEDLRDIVPYQSDIDDLSDAVGFYIAQTRRRMEIRFDEGAYNSVRPDPIGVIARPPGFEGRLLAPRPQHWTTSSADVGLAWRRATVGLSGRVVNTEYWEMVSAAIPVLELEQLNLKIHPAVRLGQVELIVQGETPDDILARYALSCESAQTFERAINVGARTALHIRLRVRGEVDAQIDFERLRTPSAPTLGGERALRATRWEMGVPNAEVNISGASGEVRYSGASGPYLIKSYAIPTMQGARLRVGIRAHVTSGQLGAGILSRDQSRWIASGVLENGRVELEGLTGQDDGFRVVFFAASDGDLEATIQFGDATLAMEEIGETEAMPPTDLASTENSQTTDPPSANAPVDLSPPRLIAIDDPGSRKRKYFCHKPWSDLHNFTVDGRMDVCCIATGPSQERYSLGNLRSQNFQDVWNGATAKLFRRTVNSDKVLPPCARCPMGYQYHGMWFNREHTLGRVAGWVWQNRLMRHPAMNRVTRLVVDVLARVVNRLAFHRFK